MLDWCGAHPDLNLTPAAIEAMAGVPAATIRSWSGSVLPDKVDGSYAWSAESMVGWLEVHGGGLATNIRRVRTQRSLRETRDSL